MIKTVLVALLFSCIAGAQSQWKWFKNYTPNREGITFEFTHPCHGALTAHVAATLERDGKILTERGDISTDREHGDTTLHTGVIDSLKVLSIVVTCGGWEITIVDPTPGTAYQLCGETL